MQSAARNLLLETAAADLVTALGGTWHTNGSMCRCPAHEDRTPSLSIRVGTRSLLFKCFAGCTAGEVLHALRQRRLRVPTDLAAPVESGDDAPSHVMLGRARGIWDEALLIGDDPAEQYLRARGITICSPALRFHPRTPIGRGRAVHFRPAIIAAIGEGRRFVGIQRIFLEPDGASLARDLARPKHGLSRPLGGAVQLQSAAPVLGLAEGVETALSAAILLGIPVWAALGAERLHRICVPRSVRRLILLPDNDAAGRAAVSRAEQAYAGCGFDLDCLWPWGRQNDWNDVLLRPALWEEREEVGVRLAV